MERVKLPDGGCQRAVVAAQALFRAMQRGDVACDSNLSDQFALRVQQWRCLEGDSDDFAGLFAPLGGAGGRVACANAVEKAGVIGIGEVGGMQLAKRLADGFVCVKTVQGGRFAVPVGDDRRSEEHTSELQSP